MIDTDDLNQQAYTVKTRKCTSCGDAGMAPAQRQFSGMETTIIYACPSCEAQVEFKSLSQAGIMTALALIVLMLIAVVSSIGSGLWDTGDYLLYMGVVILFLYVPGSILVPYWCHPVTGEKQIKESGLDFNFSAFSEDFSDAMQRAIIKFERHGFWRGFLTPIIFIAVILAVATAIGMVNFYVFEA